MGRVYCSLRCARPLLLRDLIVHQVAFGFGSSSASLASEKLEARIAVNFSRGESHSKTYEGVAWGISFPGMTKSISIILSRFWWLLLHDDAFKRRPLLFVSVKTLETSYAWISRYSTINTLFGKKTSLKV